jgi:RNA exonuclease 1
MMMTATKTLAQVKEDLMHLMDSDTILLGHALENDLTVLKIIHKRVIDTSILFSSKTGKRPTLKEIAFSYAKVNIQGVGSIHSGISQQHRRREGGTGSVQVQV